MRVMLDFDLAEIYGYSVKAFNQQVKNNIEKFDEDFRFQLNIDEVMELSRSKFLTSIQVKGVKGGRSYLPYAFTEQGIYMLMTVLRGDLKSQNCALHKLMSSLYILPKEMPVLRLISATLSYSGAKRLRLLWMRSLIFAFP